MWSGKDGWMDNVYLPVNVPQVFFNYAPQRLFIVDADCCSGHTFSAFWLRSSVVSVLISVKTDMLSIA